MNQSRRTASRSLAVGLAAVSLAAVSSLPATASAVPTSTAGSVAAPAAASVLAARSVTPPRAVTKSQLVRIFRAAARATDAGLRRGASLRSVQEIRGQRSVGTGRARAGRILLGDSTGSTSILDARSGSSYVSIAGLVAGLGVSPAELEAALATLGKPGATWAETAGGPPSGGAIIGKSLVSAAKAATSWSWQRRKGLTTWRLTSQTRGIRSTQVFVLDSRQRLVRESETAVSTMSTGPRLTVRSTLTFRYRSVAPITLPTPAQTVGFVELLRLLARGPAAR